uniref:TOD1/MUCI70 glycosyltransferase-like domain-containing protein n=1 Tax=Tanacetum cinerariifolium TaxID=118510 RepID=A0A6L2KWH8_TANCI|nr:hypothetical protein CTI12_AA161950 [Tanacetum cinerariifolium]
MFSEGNAANPGFTGSCPYVDTSPDKGIRRTNSQDVRRILGFIQSSPNDPIQTPLFNYPKSYSQHKHPIPTTHSSCNFPVFFKDYLFVVNEIRRAVKDSTARFKSLRYVQGNGNGGSFGMNYSIDKRMSYFDYRDDGTEIPCGFLKKFPISDYDRIAMESCKGVVVVSAIFGDHDKIRQPKGLGYKTLDHVCFYMFVDEATLQQFHHHNLLSRKAKETKDVDMAISKHPFYVHTMEEAMATARWKKWWDVDSLRVQIETYCENGLQPWSSKKHPYPSDVPDSAIILRKHGVASNLFSCLLYNELEAFNPRDQLAFAFVRDHMNPKMKINMFDVEKNKAMQLKLLKRDPMTTEKKAFNPRDQLAFAFVRDHMNPKMKINMFDVEVFEHVALEYRHNIKRSGSVVIGQPARTKRASPASGSIRAKCDSYLQEMSGESQN